MAAEVVSPVLRGADGLRQLKAVRESLLTSIVNELKHHPGLGVWKGADEPAHGHVPPAGLRAVPDHIHELDPNHPKDGT